MKRTPWQRLALSLVGIAVIGAAWRVAVQNLYSLPAASLASFTTITVDAFFAVSAIVVFMVTGRLVYDWKMNTTSNVVEEGRQVVQEFIDRSPRPRDHENEFEPLP